MPTIDIDNLKEEYIDEELSYYFNTFIHNAEELMFITLTLKPTLYKYQSITQYELTIPYVRSICQTFSNRFCITTEMTLQANIHYHILIHFDTSLKRIAFINKVRKCKFIGFYKISPEYKDFQGVFRSIQYLTKDLDTTKKVLWTTNYRPEILIIN